MCRAIADHRARGAVTRHGHRRQRAPRIRQRVVRLDGSIRADELLRGDFASGHVDAAAVRAGHASAAGGGHPLLRHVPGVRGGVVLLHHIRVRGAQDEGVAGAAADDVNLPVDGGRERVIPRHRHRLAGLPLVRGGVVHLVDAEHPGWSEGGEERVLRVAKPALRIVEDRSFHRCRTADRVDLAADLDGHRGSALRGQRRQRLPGIGDRIVLPRVVDGLPCGAERESRVRWRHEAAHHVDLAVCSGQRGMVRRPRHRLFLRPLVGGRVVLVVDPASLAVVPASDDVQFAVHGNAVQLLIRLRERCALLPGRIGHLRMRRRDERHAGNQQREHRGSPLYDFRHEPLLGSH